MVKRSVITEDGEEEIDGARYHVLKLTLADGFENYLFVDQATGGALSRRACASD